jgi:hypothetical protein
MQTFPEYAILHGPEIQYNAALTGPHDNEWVQYPERNPKQS